MKCVIALALPLLLVSACAPADDDETAEIQHMLIAGPSTLDVDAVLNPGESRSTAGGRFKLIYQWDGNLVLYDNGTPLWHTHTSGTSPGRTVMQGDGNLVVYDAGGTPVWYSATFWQGTTAWVNLDMDWQGVATGTGNLALCDTIGNLVWASNGNPNACKFVAQGGTPPAGGGSPGRTCAASCTGCMPLWQCLSQSDQRYESCESTGFEGTDGACYRLDAGPATCEQINPWSRTCGQCWIDCEGVCPSSIPPLCTCESTGQRDRKGNECCYMETQDPWC